MFYVRLLCLATIICFTQTGQAQQAKKTVIQLTNPSFEGRPNAGGRSMYIAGWNDCGKYRFPGESAPDLQPGFFLVDLEAHDGDSYLGMVARDNETWESVTQGLYKSLKAGSCYNFSLHLATSTQYSSPARRSGVMVEEAIANGEPLDSIAHTDPIVLRIWGGATQCAQTELLGETAPISNKSWKKFDFRLEPKQDLRYIMLEAFYKTPSLFPQNGHLLIDDLSDIVGIPCNMEPPLVSISKPSTKANTKEEAYQVKANLENVFSKEDIVMSLNDKQFTDFEFDMSTGNLTANIPLRNGNNKVQIKASNSEGEDSELRIVKREEEQVIAAVEPTPKPTVPTTTSKPKEDNTLEGVRRNDLKKDQKLEIKNISFKADSTNIQKSYEPTLKKIADFLTANNDVIIEIGGHTNNSCDDIVCNRLSEERAKSVMNYLINSGVSKNQLRSKGYGRTQPIASNNSSYGRRRNQRVEIKILDIDS